MQGGRFTLDRVNTFTSLGALIEYYQSNTFPRAKGPLLVSDGIYGPSTVYGTHPSAGKPSPAGVSAPPSAAAAPAGIYGSRTTNPSSGGGYQKRN